MMRAMPISCLAGFNCTARRASGRICQSFRPLSGMRGIGLRHGRDPHVSGRRPNNRAEGSHQPTRRRERQQIRFNSPGSAQRFLSSHAAIADRFNVRRHLISRRTLKTLRAWASANWREIVAVRGRPLKVFPTGAIYRDDANLTRSSASHPSLPKLIRRQRLEGHVQIARCAQARVGRICEGPTVTQRLCQSRVVELGENAGRQGRFTCVQ